MARTTKKPARKLWTAAEVKDLKTLAGRHTLTAIARRLKRTPQAVRRKATIKGISLAMK